VEHGGHRAAPAARPGHDALAVSRHCLDPEKQPHHHQATLNPVTPIFSADRVCGRRRQEPRPSSRQPLDPDAKTRPAHRCGADKPVVTIIVAGETARARNFSLGGYPAQDQPGT
jgi:glucan phosphoethanolaminetransferase (alkaline phosphatase superfamily)